MLLGLTGVRMRETGADTVQNSTQVQPSTQVQSSTQAIEYEILRTNPVRKRTRDLRDYTQRSLSTTSGEAPSSVVRGMYNVPKATLTVKQLSTLRRELTATPKQSRPGQPEVSWPMYTESPTWFRLPRFEGLRRMGPAQVDYTTDGQPISIEMQVQPRSYQKPVVEALSKIFVVGGGPGAGALLLAECGVGKTFMSIFLSSLVGRKTAIIVHKSDLMMQWKEAYGRFTTARVGIVRGDICEVDGCDVTIFMAQTIVTGRYDSSQIYDQFGMLVVDECHHWAARRLSECLRRFPARCVLGLTATPNRTDGLGHILPWFFGPVAARVWRTKGHGTNRVRVRAIKLQRGEARPCYDFRGQIVLPRVVSQLVKDQARNERIVSLIRSSVQEDRHVLVMSERRKHLEALLALYEATPDAVPAGLFVGETTKKGIARRTAHMHRQVLFCTTKMAEEGFDQARLCTLIFATPKKNIEQAVGRVQRAHPDKKTPLVYDLVDEYIPSYVNMFRARCRLYRKHKFLLE